MSPAAAMTGSAPEIAGVILATAGVVAALAGVTVVVAMVPSTPTRATALASTPAVRGRQRDRTSSTGRVRLRIVNPRRGGCAGRWWPPVEHWAEWVYLRPRG